MLIDREVRRLSPSVVRTRPFLATWPLLVSLVVVTLLVRMPLSFALFVPFMIVMAVMVLFFLGSLRPGPTAVSLVVFAILL